MRSEQEIRDRLRDLHGQYCPREAGGFKGLARTRELLWVLGHDNPEIIDQEQSRNTYYIIDVSEYVEVDDE